MTDHPQHNDAEVANDFARQSQEPRVGFLREFLDFLRYEKKWWLTPIVVVLLLVGLLVVLGGTPLAPFIYTMW